MAGLESDTIGGFNSMIEKQKKQDGECYVSTVLFDDDSEFLHDRVRLTDIPQMTDKDYTVRGCTALIDAIGGAIHHIGNTFISTLVTRTCRSIRCSLSQPTDKKMQSSKKQGKKSVAYSMLCDILGLEEDDEA